MKTILRDYHNYLLEHRDSLLTRYYAFFELVYPSSSYFNRNSSAFFVVMENSLFTDLDIHEVYDLKGSTINRSVPVHKRTPSIALKDLDFTGNKRGIVIGKTMSAKLLLQIQNDTKFLSERKILDYSFLVGIHFGDKKSTAPKSPRKSCARKSYQSLFQRSNGGIKTNLQIPVYFFVGLIDILTPWNVSKRGEHQLKTFVLSQDPTKLSAVPPDKYYVRFMNFMNKIIT